MGNAKCIKSTTVVVAVMRKQIERSTKRNTHIIRLLSVLFENVEVVLLLRVRVAVEGAVLLAVVIILPSVQSKE